MENDLDKYVIWPGDRLVSYVVIVIQTRLVKVRDVFQSTLAL